MTQRTPASGPGTKAARHLRPSHAAAVAAALAVALPGGTAYAADTLSGAEIRALLTDSEAKGTTETAEDVTVVFSADGTVAGRAQSLMFVEEDTGIWEIEGDRLCVRWQSWADAERTCLMVERRDGGNGGYESYTADGTLRTFFHVKKIRAQIGATGAQELDGLYADPVAADPAP